MNVPPLCTVAVSARAQAPRARFPRKYASRNRPRAEARAASVPSQTEATTTPNSVARAPQPGVATAAARASRSGIIRVLAQLAELVVAHEPPREPGRDQHTDAPRRHDPPEHPGGEPQHEPDRLARAAVAAAG